MGLKAPFAFFRSRSGSHGRQAYRQRRGWYDSKFKQALTNRDAIWMHAETPEEVNLCTHLIRILEPRIPNVKIVASARTTAGLAELTRKLPTHVSKIYFPNDRRVSVSRALAVIRPMLVILVEPRVAPNFVWRARGLGWPVVMVNPRMPEARFRHYRRFGFMYRTLFASLASVCVRTDQEAARWRALGCRSEAILVTGDLPSTAAKLHERRVLDVPSMLDQMGVGRDPLLWVCGGTCEGEEEVLVERFQALRARFPSLFLVLAPRRFERCRELGGLLRARGIKFVYRNEITPASRLEAGSVECLLLNTTGELRHFYDRATVIFVGSTFSGDGTQDPVEPGIAGRPLLFGPRTGSFSTLYTSLIQEGGGLLFSHPAELEKAMSSLLEDEARRENMGHQAIQAIREDLGGIDRTVEMIVGHLAGEEIYFAPGLRK